MPSDEILTFDKYVIGVEDAPGVELELPQYYHHYNGYLEHWFNRRRGETLPVIDPSSLDVDSLNDATLEVNHGRWCWQCPACHNGELVEDESLVICYQCATGGWHAPRWPANRAEIEAELLRQPGYRLFSPVRNWEPGWSMEYLQERTAKANLLLASGISLVRSLSIGTPRVWVDGEVATATNFNLYISDILDDLASRNGEQELEDSLRILDGSMGNRFFGLPGGTNSQRPTGRAGMMRFNTTQATIDLHDGTAWRQIHDAKALNYQALVDNGLVGTAAGTLSIGNHSH